jgi:hypothetical protein
MLLIGHWDRMIGGNTDTIAVRCALYSDVRMVPSELRFLIVDSLVFGEKVGKMLCCHIEDAYGNQQVRSGPERGGYQCMTSHLPRVSSRS